MHFLKSYFILLISSTLMLSCSETEMPQASEFTIQDEKNLGAALSASIENDSSGIALLEKSEFQEIFNYLDQRRNFLTSNPLIQRNTFVWEVQVYESQAIQAFTLPGGYLYFSSSLIKALENESQLLAIMGFQMALADQGFALAQVEEAYGLALLLDVSLGSNTDVNQELIDILTNNVYSRDQVELSETISMDLLCETDFLANGLIEMLEIFSGIYSSQTDWERLYPGNGERIPRLSQRLDTLMCEGELNGFEAFQNFKELLP